MLVYLQCNKSIENMNIVNTLNIHTSNFINGRKGTYRVVIKCPAGFYTIKEIEDFNGVENRRTYESPAEILSWYKKGALATIEFKANDSNHFLTVFAMKGKKCVLIDEDILKGLTVGTINQYWSETNLYSQMQYSIVNAQNWASKAFIMNAA
jgi:hypothetical protein